MANPIIMPDLGTTVEEIRLTSWLKQPGDAVRRGEPLCEVETDKAAGEVECPADGVLLCHVVAPGALITKGTTIAFVGQAGETVEARTLASAKRAAIRVEAAMSPEAAPEGPGKPLTGNQRAVARRVQLSHRDVVAFDMATRIDMTAAMAFRNRMQTELRRRLTFDSIFIYACARVLKEFPRFLLHMAGERLVGASGMHIAFAAGFRDALYLLTVRDADTKGVGEIESEVQRLTTVAASRQIPIRDITSACFAVSNLGMYPVHSFDVVIPPGQAAALGVACIEERVVLRDAQVATVPMVNVTLTSDHRVVNGRDAASFLTRLKEFMEAL